MIKYLFCVSPGRSGTKYLAEIFNYLEGVKAFHETDPVMNGIVMKSWLNSDGQLLVDKMPQKVERIKGDIDGSKLYVETNHCFIKGFGWLLPDYINPTEIGVIELHREKEDVFKSMLRIGSTPLIPTETNWLLTPLAKNKQAPLSSITSFLYPFMMLLGRFFRSKYNFFRSPFPSFVTRYENKLIKWHIDESYARGHQFNIQFPDIKYYSCSLKELNTRQGVSKLFAFFNLDFELNAGLLSFLGNAQNIKSHRANNAHNPTDQTL